MRQRYKQKQLQLLRSTDKALLYCSKKNKNGFTDLSFMNNHKQLYSSAEQTKRQSFQFSNSYRKNQSKQSIGQIKKKIHHLLLYKQEYVASKNHTQLQNGCINKNQPHFRISFFKSHTKRNQNLQKLQQRKKQQIYRPKEFKTGNIPIKKIQDLKEWKNNELFSFRRDFLRKHGENKCFYNALKMRDQKIQINLNKQWQFLRMNTKKISLNRQGSLEYSTQNLDMSDIESWRRSNKQIEQMELSQYQDKGNQIKINQ